MLPTNLEWENANALRNYPLREGVNREASNGLRLPHDALVDFMAFVPAGDDEDFYVSSIEVGRNLVVTFTVSGVQTDNVIGSFAMPAIFEAQQSFEFSGTGLGTTGKAVIGGGMRQVQMWGVGTFNFESSQSTLEASTIIPLEAGVVTSVGILGVDRVLVGDVKILFGRAIEGDTEVVNNSVVLSAIKRVEDCEPKVGGCPLQSINGLTPDSRGNIQLTAEGILKLNPGVSGSGEGGEGAPGLTIKTILKQDQLCVRPFEPGLRGADGGSGGTGPAGGGGANVQCCPAICQKCETCDTCEQWDNPLSPARVIGGGKGPGAGGGGVGGGGIGVAKPLLDEGDILTIGGIGLTPETVDCVIFCSADGTHFVEQPLQFYGTERFDVQVPLGLTTTPGPTPDNTYIVRVKTPWGFTNKLYICVNPAGAVTKWESFDSLLPFWFDIRGPFTFIEAVGQFEGAGAFNIQNILPFGTVANFGGNLSGFGAPPWDFSPYSGVQIYVAKEFDPGEFGPADSLEVQMTDSAFNVKSFQVPIPGAARYPAPHVVNAGDYVPVQLNFAAGFGFVNLNDVIGITVGIFDFGAFVPVQGWIDCGDVF